MNWRQWKLGLLVAVLSGLASGAAGWALGLTPKQLAGLFMVNVGKDVGLFLKSHPANDINFDTTTFNKPKQPNP